MTWPYELPETLPLDRIEESGGRAGADAPETGGPADPETRDADGLAERSEPVVPLSGGTVAGRGWVARLLLAGCALLAAALAGVLVERLVVALLAGGGWALWATVAGIGLLAVAGLATVLREVAAMARLRRLGRLQQRAAALADGGATRDPELLQDLERLVRGRPELRWGLHGYREELAVRADDRERLFAFEDQVVAQMDARAGRAIARAVRRAGSATAISPFPVLDMLAAAVIDARLVGELARIYGGRPGALAGLRLLRTAFVNVLAAGGLDTIEDAAGDLVGTGLTARLSTRAGAALVNGLLTARIGLAAADACRPLPWRARRRPSARRFVRSALTGRSSERG